MIFTTAVTVPPTLQLYEGAPAVSGQEASGTTTHTLSATDENPRLTGLIEPNPNLLGKYGLLVFAGFNRAPHQVEDIDISVTGNLATDDCVTWDNLPVAVSAGGVLALAPAQFMLALIPNSWLPLASVSISYPSNANLMLDWLVCSRVIAVAYPTLAIKARYAHDRRVRKTLTGKRFSTAVSPDPLFSCDLALTNDFRDDLPEDLALLDSQDVFGCFPGGLESVLRQSVMAYRRPGFMRNMVVEKWTGWTGHRGLDSAGASGKLRISESGYHASPVVALDASLTTEAGDPITTEEGGRILINR